jgi:hypothetical protein
MGQQADFAGGKTPLIPRERETPFDHNGKNWMLRLLKQP